MPTSTETREWRCSNAVMNAITMAIVVVGAVAIWIVPRLIFYRIFRRYTDTLLESRRKCCGTSCAFRLWSRSLARGGLLLTYNQNVNKSATRVLQYVNLTINLKTATALGLTVLAAGRNAGRQAGAKRLRSMAQGRRPSPEREHGRLS